MGLDESRMTRLVMRELGRRPIDISRLSVRFSHGVVYFYGTVSKARGHENLNLRDEMEIVHNSLRSKQGIKEVHLEELVLRQ
jgi:hypothetical protein